MMKKLVLIIPTLLIIFTSCTERIDIELDETYTRLVVYGAITTDTARHAVELSKTTSYYYTEAPPPVTGARVEISDDLGNVAALEELEQGKYFTSPDFAAVAGRTYTLQIDLDEEINGHSSYTATSKAGAVFPIDSIGLVPQPDWGENGFIEITCYYQDPPDTNYYMFNIIKNGELLTDTITNRFTVDDSFFNGNYTNGISVGFLDQSNEREILNAGDTVTFQGCNIPEDYYEFILSLQSETGFQNPLFSGPPANVRSNISNGAAGYFAAYSVSYSSTVFQPE